MMTRIQGCCIEPIGWEDAVRWLAWTAGNMPAPCESTVCWLLAHCDDGVVWGRRHEASEHWHLSSEVFPHVSPAMSELNLLELRLFGRDEEILLWRSEEGLRGRRLGDAEALDDGPARPDDDVRILLGNRILGAGSRHGFTRVGDASGAEHAVPLVCDENDFRHDRWPLRLRVRHYFEADSETGVVRVAASRLVWLEKDNALPYQSDDT